MNGSQLTITGNVTADPELRFTPGGDAVLDIRVASNRSWKDGDDWEEETTFYKATFWGKYAENIADSIEKGTSVIVTGQLEVETWENDDGEEKFNLKIRGDEFGILLKWQTAEVERVKSEGGGGSKRSGGKSGGRNGGRSSKRGSGSGRGSRERKSSGRDGGYNKDEEPF
ncbi:UNVERIFIED_CONTAM: hypothetical protein GTU68_008957 [Idotea baltica]|nr:hypothetical protein [Idotea baltica]